MKNFTPPLRNYRDFENEKPPQAPPGETREQRIARVLRQMPLRILNNPELRLKALKKAAENG